jgi:hypothetical protein
MNKKSINKFGVDTNNLEFNKIYTLHTKKGKAHTKFKCCTQLGAMFFTLCGTKFLTCSAQQIADYDGR